MQAIAENGLMLALFNPPGFEIILILALVLILFGAKKLPELARGLGRGIFKFREATKKVEDEIDDEASEAGRSVGGIYKPAVFETEAESRRSQNGVMRLFKQLWYWLLRFLLRREGAS